MSKHVTTVFGRFKQVSRDGVLEWLFECPICKGYGGLDEDQWNGRVSVDHAATLQAVSPSQRIHCTYHETHNYQAALRAVIASRLLTCSEPYDVEDQQ